MKEEFILFQKFNAKNDVLEVKNLFVENNIESLIEDITLTNDLILPNIDFTKEYYLKIRKTDFEKANYLILENSKIELDEVQKDYYLLNFSNDELFEVIEKSDEWNKLDVVLAHKLLKERGIEVSIETINKLKDKRLADLSKPEENQKLYIVIGYLCAFLGGILGVFIGWHLLTFKKSLPNGTKIYEYSLQDRKHGNRIVIISIIILLSCIIYKFFI